ncbi:hypothetical protein NG799_02365 [Laspinema sp. D1]|uniref:Uncharacterized protein n=1 Tax=Laspinema palackyanum D2a TaxID=2953684 RepID=A0ABT2ML16_9CYAN|nr:hypothetical protein [Laspinema sp. D2a]
MCNLYLALILNQRCNERTGDRMTVAIAFFFSLYHNGPIGNPGSDRVCV